MSSRTTPRQAAPLLLALVCAAACSQPTARAVEDGWPGVERAALEGYVWVPLDAPMASSPQGLEGLEEVGPIHLDPWASERDALRAQPMEILEDRGDTLRVRSLRNDQLLEHCSTDTRSYVWSIGEFEGFVRRADLVPVLAREVTREFPDGTSWTARAGTPAAPDPSGAESVIADGKVRLTTTLERADVAMSYPLVARESPRRGSRMFLGPSVLVLGGKPALRADEIDPWFRIIRSDSNSKSMLGSALNMPDDGVTQLIGLEGPCISMTVSTPPKHVWTAAITKERMEWRQVARDRVSSLRSVKERELMSGMKMTWKSGAPAGVVRRAGILERAPHEVQGQKRCYTIPLFEEKVCVDMSQLP